MEKQKRNAARRVQSKLERLEGLLAPHIEIGRITAPVSENIGAAE